MTNDEYREFLTFLFERYVRPRLGRVRRRFHRHMMEEWVYHIDQAQHALQVLRYIDTNCDDDDDIYRTFTLERLTRAVSDTHNAVQFGDRMAEEAGFLDALEAHADDILSGLEAQHLPDADREIFREMGSLNPDMELRALVLRAKSSRDRLRQNCREISIRQQLKHAEERVGEAQKDFERIRKAQQEAPDKERPSKGCGSFETTDVIGHPAFLRGLSANLWR